jgi:hypothetical protein
MAEEFLGFVLPESGNSRIMEKEVVFSQHDGLLAREVVASLALWPKRDVASGKEVVSEIFLY